MKRSSELGAVMAETALVIPILVLLIMGVVDFGRLLNTHFAASRIAFEAVRFAASVPQLEKGTFAIAVQASGTSAVTEGAPAGNQDRIVKRLERLMVQLNAQHELVGQVGIRTKYEDDCSNKASSSGNKAVHVDVEIPFKPLLPLISISQVKAHADSAYLFAGC